MQTRHTILPALAALLASALAAPMALAHEGHKSCSDYKNAAVRKACASAATPEERQAAIKAKVMKPATAKGKEMGLVTSCKTCHTDLTTFATTKEAAASLDKILAEPHQTEPALSPEAKAATQKWLAEPPVPTAARPATTRKTAPAPVNRESSLRWVWPILGLVLT
jgi:hypothetical protein